MLTGSEKIATDTCRRMPSPGASCVPEHGVRVGGGLGNPLEHVPVLNNLSLVIEPKKIETGPIAISGPVLKAMQDDVVIFGQHSPELNALARYSRAMRSKYSMNASFPRRPSVVLGVGRANMATYRFGRLALIEHQIHVC